MEVGLFNVHYTVGNSRNCSKTPKTLIRDVSVAFPARSFTFVIGPNGAGKSILLKLVGGVMDPTYGSIKRPFKKVAYIGHPLDECVLVDQTTTELIAHAYFMAYGEVHARETLKQMVHETIVALLLQSVQYEKYSKLSRGQQARVLLACALAQTPELLVVDGLIDCMSSSEISVVVEGLLLALAKGPITIVVSSNNIFSLEMIKNDHREGHAYNVVVMTAGFMVFAGPVETALQFFQDKTKYELPNGLQDVVQHLGKATESFKEHLAPAVPIGSIPKVSTIELTAPSTSSEKKRQTIEPNDISNWNVQTLRDRFLAEHFKLAHFQPFLTHVEQPPTKPPEKEKPLPLPSRHRQFIHLLNRQFETFEWSIFMWFLVFVLVCHLQWPSAVVAQDPFLLTMQKANLVYASLVVTALAPWMSSKRFYRARQVFAFESGMGMYTPIFYFSIILIGGVFEAFLHVLPFLVLFSSNGVIYLLISLHYAFWTTLVQATTFMWNHHKQRGPFLLGLVILNMLLLSGNLVPREIMPSGMQWMSKLSITETMYSYIVQVTCAHEPALIAQLLIPTSQSLAGTILGSCVYWLVSQLVFAMVVIWKLRPGAWG